MATSVDMDRISCLCAISAKGRDSHIAHRQREKQTHTLYVLSFVIPCVYWVFTEDIWTFWSTGLLFLWKVPRVLAAEKSWRGERGEEKRSRRRRKRVWKRLSCVLFCPLIQFTRFGREKGKVIYRVSAKSSGLWAKKPFACYAASHRVTVTKSTSNYLLAFHSINWFKPSWQGWLFLTPSSTNGSIHSHSLFLSLSLSPSVNRYMSIASSSFFLFFFFSFLLSLSLCHGCIGK